MVFDHQLHELWQSNQLTDYQIIRHSASSHLAAFIEQYFVVSNPQQNATPVYILPDLSGHLILYQNKGSNGYTYDFRCVGSRSVGFRINRGKRVRTFIVRFHPGVFSKLTQVLGKASSDQSFALAHFFPHISEQLTALFSEKMHTEEDFKYLFQWLEIHLLEPLQAHLQLPKALAGFLTHLKQKDVDLNVNATAKQLGISTRYLHKISIQYLGVPPNKALRIVRLVHSFKNRIQHPQYNWSDIAFLAGYADQSHMMRIKS